MITKDRVAVALTGLVALLVTAWMLFGGAEETPEAAPPAAEAPEPTPPARQASAPAVYHLPHPDLSEEELPPPRPPDPDAEPLSVPDRAAFNKAVNHGVRDAHAECVEPWLSGAPLGPFVELVVNARVVDGDVIDLELRSIEELPADLVECVRDVLWERDWPSADVTGEVRFQEMLEAVAR